MQSKSDLFKLIKSISTRGRALDRDIQTAALGSVFYSVCRGDITIGQKLLECLPKGTRNNAVRAFLEHFGQFEVKGKGLIHHSRKAEVIAGLLAEDGAPVTFGDLLEDEEGSELYLQTIKKEWTAFKPEPTPASTWDCKEKLQDWLKLADKNIANGKAAHGEIRDLVAQLVESMDEVEEEEGEDESLATGTND